MSFLDDIPAPTRRTDRKPCQHCDASAAGCRSVKWLRGQACCDRCQLDHDRPERTPR